MVEINATLVGKTRPKKGGPSTPVWRLKDGRMRRGGASSSGDRDTKIRRIKEEAARICLEHRLRILVDPALAELDRLLKRAEKADRDQRGADKIVRFLLDF